MRTKLCALFLILIALTMGTVGCGPWLTDTSIAMVASSYGPDGLELPDELGQPQPDPGPPAPDPTPQPSPPVPDTDMPPGIH